MNVPKSEYQRWYKTAAWQKRRLDQLGREPLCRECNRIGILTAANVADHIEAHRGDIVKFWEGALQSLCRSCHNSFKQAKEKSGRAYSTVVGLDGFPVDPTHPFHQGKIR
jgi:5-methylcytosine-specific restriction enzyme A